MNKKKEILTIVVTYNGGKWIDICFGSLINSIQPTDIICIDNMSSDNTVNEVNTKYPSVILKEANENLGFGKANNIGLKYALEHDYDYVFLLNQDASVQQSTIGNLIEVAEANPDFGIISPIHLNGKGDALDLNFSNCLGAYNCPQLLSDLILKDDLNPIYSTTFVNAAAWLLPINTLRKIGGFDPIFYHYGEDDNYCQRVHFHGLKIGIVPNTYISHDRPQKAPFYRAFSNFKDFEREFKKKVGDINAESFEKIFTIEVGKIKKNFYASLFTIDLSNSIRWNKFVRLANRLKPVIKESFEKNRILNPNHLE